MKPILVKTAAVLAMTAGAVWLVVGVDWRDGAGAAGDPTGGAAARAVPVELAAVERGEIVEQRTFSGTLEPRAQFVVAPKVSGRIESLRVDIGDEVAPGDVVATLDDDEFQQAVAEAQAELEVAKAQVVAAESALGVARSTFDRVTGLQEIEIASGSEFDVARADLGARQAQVDVAEARVQRAAAGLEAARVRLGYTQVTARWGRTAAPRDGEAADRRPRVVAQRYLDEGATVAANAPIVTVVDIEGVRAVISVTERDFARLMIGMPATVRTDAWPGAAFAGRVLRMAPVFEATSRQMRVEVDVPNPDRRLRPGMFVRVEVALSSADAAVIVPEAALVRRDSGDGVFVVDGATDRVRFEPVTVGITAGDRVQVVGDDVARRVAGRVVTLGQHLLEDGARVRVPGPIDAAGPDGR